MSTPLYRHQAACAWQQQSATTADKRKRKESTQKCLKLQESFAQLPNNVGRSFSSRPTLLKKFAFRSDKIAI